MSSRTSGTFPKLRRRDWRRRLPFPGVIDTLEFQRNYLNYGSVYFQRGYLDQAEASFQTGSARRSVERRGALRAGKRLSEAGKDRRGARKLRTRDQTASQLSRHSGQRLEQPRPSGHARRAHRRSDSVFPEGAQTQSRSFDCAREPGQRLSPAEELGRGPQSAGTGGGGRSRRIRRRTTAWGWSSRNSTTTTALTNICSER